MPTDVKRMRFFDGLFLRQEELNLEQDYHKRMRRLHNRHFHGYGIAWGLDVEIGPNASEIRVTPGMAIDHTFDSDYSEEVGREIHVAQDQVLDLVTIYGNDASVYVYLTYKEEQADVVPDRGGSDPIHWQESFNLEHGPVKPNDPEVRIILAKVNIVAGSISASGILTEENGESLRTYANAVPESTGGGGTTIIQTGGAGKNYVTNPDAETDTQGWTDAASGNLTVGSTSAGNQVLSGGQSFTLAANIAVNADTDYVIVGTSSLDEEDKNQLFVIELSFKGITNFDGDSLKVVVRDTFNNVDIVPSPAKIPAGQGKYRGTFTTSDSRTYELRLVAGVSSQDFVVAIDSVRMGPNDVTVGPAIGGWQKYDLEIRASDGNSPSKAANPDVDDAFWRRVGDSMEIIYTYRHTNNSGAVGGGTYYLFSLPSGFTIDTSKIPNFVAPDDFIGPTVGSYSARRASGTRQYQTGNVIVGDSTGLQLFEHNDWGGAIIGGISTNYNIADSLVEYSFHATVPIAQWQSDVILTESRTEYVYNSDTANGDDTTSFATGEIGGLVPNIPLDTVTPVTGFVRKRCRVTRPYKHFRLEFNSGGDTFWSSEKFQPNFFHYQDLQGYSGAYIDPISPTEFDVVFQGNAHETAEAGGSTAWAGEFGIGTRWRVVASDNPFFLEAPPAVTPGEVGPWTEAGPFVWRGTVTDPVPGTTTVNRLVYRRVGESMELHGQFTQTGAGTQGSGWFLVEIPLGVRIGRLSPGAVAGAAIFSQSGIVGAAGTAQVYDDRHLYFTGVENNPPGAFDVFESDTWNFASPNQLAVSFQVTIPIDEWTNSDLVLRENLTEYIYNSDTSNGNDTANFEAGEGGGLVPNIPGADTSSHVTKRCRVSRPYKHFRLEFNPGGNTFWISDKFAPEFWERSPGVPAFYGAFIEPISATEFDVVFKGWAYVHPSSTGWDTEHTAGTRWRVVASDNPLFVETPDVTQGNTVGPWTEAGPIVFRGETTDPTPGTTPVNQIRYRRVGDTMEFAGQFYQSVAGSAGGGTYLIELPAGLNATQAAVAAGGNRDNNAYGTCLVALEGVDGAPGVVVLRDSRHIALAADYLNTSTQLMGSTTLHMGNNLLYYAFHGSVPIAEWSGSQVVLSENRVEYVYNFDLTTNNDTASFAAGEDGSVVPSFTTGNPGGNYKRISFSRVFKHVRLEVKQHGGNWADVGSTYYSYHILQDAGRGMFLAPVSGSQTDYDVVFANAGIHRHGGQQNDWSTEAGLGTRYRVVGCDNPLFVQSPEAEFLTTIADEHTPAGSAISHQMTGNSVLLTAGSWRVNGEINFSSPSGASNYSNFAYFWAVTNGDNTTNTPSQIVADAGRTANSTEAPVQNGYFMATSSIRVSVTAPTELFLVPSATMTNPANSRINLTIYAERVD